MLNYVFTYKAINLTIMLRFNKNCLRVVIVFDLFIFLADGFLIFMRFRIHHK